MKSIISIIALIISFVNGQFDPTPFYLTTRSSFTPIDKQYVSAGSTVSLANGTRAWHIGLLDGVRSEWDPPRAPTFSMVDPRPKISSGKLSGANTNANSTGSSSSSSSISATDSSGASLPDTWNLFMNADASRNIPGKPVHRLALFRPEGVFGRLDLIAVDAEVVSERMKPVRADLGWDTFHLDNGTFTYSIRDGTENVLTKRHWVLYAPKDSNVTGQLNLALWDGVTVSDRKYIKVQLRACSTTLDPVGKDEYTYKETE